jgi:hypothetical protein
MAEVLADQGPLPLAQFVEMLAERFLADGFGGHVEILELVELRLCGRVVPWCGYVKLMITAAP